MTDEDKFDVLVDCLEKGMTQKETAEIMGCSPATISKRIADLQTKQGVLLQYRAIQSLQLTELQARILESITPEKIDNAPLKDLVLAFKILKDHELTLEGKPNEYKGLVGYLIKLEKEEAAVADRIEAAIDAEYKEIEEPTKEYIPKL